MWLRSRSLAYSQNLVKGKRKLKAKCVRSESQSQYWNPCFLIFKEKIFIFVCAHMCTGAHEQMYVSAEAKGQLKCLPQLLFTIFFGTMSLLKLEAWELATLGDQQTPGILLTLPHQHWVYRLCGWESTLRSSPLSSKHFADGTVFSASHHRFLTLPAVSGFYYCQGDAREKGFGDVQPCAAGSCPCYKLIVFSNRYQSENGEGCWRCHLGPWELWVALLHLKPASETVSSCLTSVSFS